ncbi:hypothetical protein, partial [Burkholderia ubonensis]|uniref:hypothetical protein n=1 Tax=Burkholderia ubonensis TaxID=101571 RepID=UPI001E42C5B4
LDGNRRFHPSESGSAMQSYFWDGTLAQCRLRRASRGRRGCAAIFVRRHFMWNADVRDVDLLRIASCVSPQSI